MNEPFCFPENPEKQVSFNIPKEQPNKWLPGLGIHLGQMEGRLHGLEMRADRHMGQIKDQEARTVALEIRNLEDRVHKLETYLKLEERLHTLVKMMEDKLSDKEEEKFQEDIKAHRPPKPKKKKSEPEAEIEEEKE